MIGFFFAFASSEKYEKYQILSIHNTTARFNGIQHIPCRFMTALCPDHCNHAHDAATFQIMKYNSYKLLDEYGDEKQNTFYAVVSPNRDDSQEDEIIQQIKELDENQEVQLVWQHVYVEMEHSFFPYRQILSIKPIGFNE